MIGGNIARNILQAGEQHLFDILFVHVHAAVYWRKVLFSDPVLVKECAFVSLIWCESAFYHTWINVLRNLVHRKFWEAENEYSFLPFINIKLNLQPIQTYALYALCFIEYWFLMYASINYYCQYILAKFWVYIN